MYDHVDVLKGRKCNQVVLSRQWREVSTIPVFRQIGLRYLTISIKTASTYWTQANYSNGFCQASDVCQILGSARGQVVL